MQPSPVTLLLAIVLAAFLFADTVIILRTGHVPGLLRGRLKQRMPYGPITRTGRPGRFWAYVSGNLAVFVMAFGYIVFFALTSWR